MAFDLTIETKTDGQYNWFDLPESDRASIEEARDKFNLVQYDPNGFLTSEGPTTKFDQPWSNIVSIKIGG